MPGTKPPPSFAEFVSTCLRRRTPLEKSVGLIDCFIRKFDVSKSTIANGLLCPPKTATTDMLWLALLTHGIGQWASPDEILSALSQNDRKGQLGEGVISCIIQYLLQATDFSQAIIAHLAGTLVLWFHALRSIQENEQILAQCTMQLCIVLMQRTVTSNLWLDTHETFDAALTNFINRYAHVDPALEIQLSDLHTIFLAQTAGQKIVNTVPKVHARARLFVFFCSVLGTRPRLQDDEIVRQIRWNYANSSQDDMLAGVIIGVCDALSNVRAPRTLSLDIWRSYLISKVPLLCKGLYGEESFEKAVLKAFQTIDASVMQVMPDVDLADAEIDLLALVEGIDVRFEFVESCIVHELLTSDSTEKILGVRSLSEREPCSAEALVAAFAQDEKKIHEWIEGLDKFDGNQVEYAEAVKTILVDECREKRFSTVTAICSKLVQVPTRVDLLQLYCDDFLIPFAEALDTWKVEEDEDLQQAFEEFGVLVLFLTTYVTRSKLDPSTLSLDSNSFSKRYLCLRDRSTSLHEMTVENQKLLGEWIKALFDSAGISDMLLGSSSPQDFYLLVPSIFLQAMYACYAKILPISTVVEGIEYFMQPFLIPCISGPLIMISDQLWAQHQDPSIPMKFLSSLITPGQSLDVKAQWMYDATVRNVSHIIAPVLGSAEVTEHADEMEDLKARLHQYNFSVNDPNISVKPLTQLKESVMKLAVWSSMQMLPQNHEFAPPEYDVELLERCLKLHPVRKVFDALLDVILASDPAIGEFVLDTVAAFLDSRPVQGEIELSDFLTCNLYNEHEKILERLRSKVFHAQQDHIPKKSSDRQSDRGDVIMEDAAQ